MQRWAKVPFISSRTRTIAKGAGFLVRKFTFKELKNVRNLAPFVQLLFSSFVPVLCVAFSSAVAGSSRFYLGWIINMYPVFFKI